MMIKLVEPAAAMPVTVEQVKYDLRIDHEHEDAALADYIADAVDYVSGPDGVLGIALMPQTWALSVPRPLSALRLPVSPALELVEITYFDPEGAPQTADLADFSLITSGESSYVMPKQGKSWPSAEDRPDAYTVTFKAGYADIDAVPAGIKRAIRLIVTHWYLNRSEVVVGAAPMTIPMGAQSLLARYRRGWVG